MKKLSVILIVLFIGILVCGCTSQPAAPVATPAPTAAPTAAPTPEPIAAPTPEPTKVVVNETPKATPTPTLKPENVVTITMTIYNQVDPSGTITVPLGTKVVWTSAIGARENMIKSIGANEGLFQSGAINDRDSFSYKFEKAGIYDWVSTTNGVIKGTIVVT